MVNSSALSYKSINIIILHYQCFSAGLRGVLEAYKISISISTVKYYHIRTYLMITLSSKVGINVPENLF